MAATHVMQSSSTEFSPPVSGNAENETNEN